MVEYDPTSKTTHRRKRLNVENDSTVKNLTSKLLTSNDTLHNVKKLIIESLNIETAHVEWCHTQYIGEKLSTEDESRIGQRR
jgi:phenylpropionate dioxygenase-like ring-hydroxylating dioxygenase large terminal subunit